MIGEYKKARRLETLIEHYVDVRRRKHDFVSLSLAIRAIRQVAIVGISDESMAAMIARYAADHGLDVRFDDAGLAMSAEPA